MTFVYSLESNTEIRRSAQTRAHAATVSPSVKVIEWKASEWYEPRKVRHRLHGCGAPVSLFSPAAAVHCCRSTLPAPKQSSANFAPNFPPRPGRGRDAELTDTPGEPIGEGLCSPAAGSRRANRSAPVSAFNNNGLNSNKEHLLRPATSHTLTISSPGIWFKA